MKLNVVIVNYRTPALVLDAVSALIADPSMPEGTQIVIVDGASGDDSVRIFEDAIQNRQWAGQVELLALPVNGGFAYGNNRGISHLDETGRTAEYTWLLNPDTVPRAGAASTLLAFMDAHPKAGIAGSRLEDPDGTPQACAFRFPNPLGELEAEARFGPLSRLLHGWSVLYDVDDKPVRIDWASGASFMVRGSMMQAIGLMSERYFLYYEEVDYCLRAARAGWECWHVPASRVVHLIGQSTNVTKRDRKLPRRPAYWFESRRHYFIANHGRAYAVMADLAWIAGISLRRVRRLRRDDDTPPHLFRDFLKYSAVRRQPATRAG